jgi:hypothetical protein
MLGQGAKETEPNLVIAHLQSYEIRVFIWATVDVI